MRIRVVVQNLCRGGLRDGDGNPQDRWPALAARIRAAQPDVLLLNEANEWDLHGHRQLGRAMADLDLDVAPLPPSKSGCRSAILYRTATLGRWTHTSFDLAQETTHGFVVTAFTVPGLPAPLTFAAGHLDPYSGDRAIYEAKLLATRAYRYGPFAVVGGDMNYPPEAGPDPDYSRMRPYNLAARTLLHDPADTDADIQPDRRSAWMLRKAGYHDVAWHLSQRLGDETLLRRTASDDRIDRIHVTGPLADAVSNYQVLEEPADASDHHGIAADLDTDVIDHTNLWTYRTGSPCRRRT
ncbi:endonuclease/exonuclease/phosphatase family protein [Dactylosporangium sp. CA-233914]|uniref:endonuclease/exonuclease/phosphatase family protein n=1 Tax=Dactylosporangium sp. CA-233914 TaxID=3239934 RepID=UPI003D8B7C11